MNFTRSFMIMAVAEGVALAVYVLAQLAEIDFGSAAIAAQIAVVVAAAVVAIVAFQAWSHRNTPHTICAMLLGLIGGASLVSSVFTSQGDDIYGSAPMALLGTMALVATVAVTIVGASREGQKAS